MPQSGKSISIEYDCKELPPVPINRDLFEWAVENLIKNAIDAVQRKQGHIGISCGVLDDERVYLDIKDNGSGIHAKFKYDIFKPGYSTKKRGWGLGLNLAKRIIEEYHHGELLIRDSHPNRGTTMRIII
ncbi:MAG: HAMP domain-containing sensor histidine kinase [candidate division KSB1 bacterium]|nr:HAMP domain-containing sensor histidine kinase [candidate division KSB1 bacterium]